MKVYKNKLTSREIEVLKLITKGWSNFSISQKLFISESTTKAHLGHIFGKLKVQNRTQVALKAIKNGIL